MTIYDHISPEQAWDKLNAMEPVAAAVMEDVTYPGFQTLPAGVYDLSLAFNDAEAVSRILTAAETEPILLFTRREEEDE